MAGYQPNEDASVTAAERGTLHAALALALTLPGDVAMYLLLPVYAATFDVSLAEAGFLLAANRLVRIFGYHWVARFYARRGARAACVLAGYGAVVSAFCYAFGSGLWILLVGRLIWGLSFAALNLANQALPTAVPTGQARRAGRARAIVAVGPMIGLVASPIVALQFGPRAAILMLAAAAALAPLVAARIPHMPEVTIGSRPAFSWPGPISSWSFALGFTTEGIFVFSLGLLVAASYPEGAVLAAGLAMAARYAVEVIFSPVGGQLAHRFGARPILVSASLGCAVGLACLSATGLFLWVGIALTTMLRAIIQPLTAPLVAEAHPGADRVAALTSQATWRDIGAGTGPLAAGFLIPLMAPQALYGGSGLLLAVTSLMLLLVRRTPP